MNDEFVELACPAFVSATQGEYFNLQVFGAGSPPPKISVITALPPGLYAGGGRGGLTLSGVPQKSGSHLVTITARNTAGTVSRTVAISVRSRSEPRWGPRRLTPWRAPMAVPAMTAKMLRILPDSISAVAGEAAFVSIHAFGSPLAKIRVLGPLPPGLHASGTVGTVWLSGTPTGAGTYPVAVVAEDREAVARRIVRITVRGGVGAPLIRHWR